MQARPVTVVEAKPFSRDVLRLWSADELDEFIDFIARNPDAGVVIPDTGGVRKMRWSREGMGKRGGVRVIYFFYTSEHPLYLIAICAKAMREDLSPECKRAVRAMAAALKDQWK